MTELSIDLRAIYDLEISLGNCVARIDKPAGTACPFAVVFVSPLHLNEINSQIQLPQTVKCWESTDPHYAVERGFYCEKTRHAISAPFQTTASGPEKGDKSN